MGKGERKYKGISFLLDSIEFDWSKLHIPCGVVFPFLLGNSSGTSSFKNGPLEDQVFTCEFPSSVNFGCHSTSESTWVIQLLTAQTQVSYTGFSQCQLVWAGTCGWRDRVTSICILQVTFKNLVSVWFLSV